MPEPLEQHRPRLFALAYRMLGSIFLVDITSVRNPVFVWGYDGSRGNIHDDFIDFLANLHDFTTEGDDAQKATTKLIASKRSKGYVDTDS